MNINGVKNTYAPLSQSRKSSTSAQHNSQNVAPTALHTDTFEPSQKVNQYSTYNNTGASSAQQVVPQGNTPDITAQYFWEDPRREEKNNWLREVFGNRAQESLRTSDPINHAWRRYFDPNSQHFAGHDLDPMERRQAWQAELNAIAFFQRGETGVMGVESDWSNPIFGGRGLGSSDPNVPRIEGLNIFRESATQTFHQRNNMTRQIRALFDNNGIFIPENTRLRFLIDADYTLRVEGTDDKDLISRIEELLNRNGNARELFMHITQSRQPDSSQFPEDSFRLWRLGNLIEEFAGLNLRSDLELVDGRFVTEDGTDVLAMMSDNEVNSHAIALILDELYWLKNMGGAGNIPELTLAIDFENGNLFCVGQENGFGPGQTDWIDRLPGTDAPGARG
ncbi:MAG: DUF4885 domain-containing protein [Oscillospiraceae bacterium]|nr:DUF4885 domain-containing protein [Oscillospiraceae bacterium]